MDRKLLVIGILLGAVLLAQAFAFVLLLGLQSQVNKLNVSDTAHAARIITYDNETRAYLSTDGQWHDLISIPNVQVSQGSTVFVIVGGIVDQTSVGFGQFKLRSRAGDDINGFPDYTETYFAQSNSDLKYRNFEVHHVWTGLSAGNYTFAVQYIMSASGNPSYLFCGARLTLIII